MQTHAVSRFCENGSLQTICKKFGKFPENLVAVYISQVLEGLVYLHEQGVIHRDIKGANILTNKDGCVKLADFGVASKTTAATNNDAVVGSPYWSELFCAFIHASMLSLCQWHPRSSSSLEPLQLLISGMLIILLSGSASLNYGLQERRLRCNRATRR